MSQINVLVKQAIPNSGDLLACPQEREIMAIGAANHWPFRVLGKAPVPDHPVFVHNWWLVPATMDSTVIPPRTLERVQAIYEAGIRPKAFVIAHEARPGLPAPVSERPVSRLQVWVYEVKRQAAAFREKSEDVVRVAAPIVCGAIAITWFLTLAFASVALSDPALIICSENDVWIQVDFWNA